MVTVLGSSTRAPAAARPARPWVLAATVAASGLLVTSGALALTGSAAPGRPTDGPSGAVPAEPALHVTSTVPTDGQQEVPPDEPVTVGFSAPLAPTSPMPRLDPAVAGSWVRLSPAIVQFDPAASLPPGTTITLTVPGGAGGVVPVAGTGLAAPVTVHFTVAPMSVHRLQELLAQLGYLPLSFSPASSAPVPAAELAIDQPGTFRWRWSTLPAVLTRQWTEGTANVLTTGAVMAFEDQHGLATDGVAGPQVWRTLLAAATTGSTDSFGHWDWVDVSTALPETVTVWQDGAVVFRTLANTGIPQAPTAPGTFPVYLRYRTTTMSGTNPDGSHYSDPGVPWVSYFNGGDALHGFVRPGYGYPQSLGCVEMAPAAAQVVWPLTPIGTLVTVQ